MDCNFFWLSFNLGKFFILFIIFSDCCDTFDLTLANDANTHASWLALTYSQTTPVNGRSAWISSDGWYGIWFSLNGYWIIGSASEIGYPGGTLFSQGNWEHDCPKDASVWEVWGDDGWQVTGSGDVVIECSGMRNGGKYS